MAREEFAYHRSTVALWLCLGVLMVITSVSAAVTVGTGGLYLIVTGWIVGPFVLYWIYKKIKAIVKGG